LCLSGFLVASFTDAWIEISKTGGVESVSQVASFTDAWIEINEVTVQKKSVSVASFTDAWIEMLQKSQN